MQDVELQGYPHGGHHNYGYNNDGESPAAYQPEATNGYYGNTERKESVASTASYIPSDDEALNEVDPDALVDMLPSRTLGRGINGISGTHSVRRRVSHRAGGPVDDVANEIIEATKDDENPYGATVRRRETIREISGNISTKRAVRDKVAKKSKKRAKSTGPLKAAWYSFSYSMGSLKEQFMDFMRGLALWKSSIKRIEGNYGSSVTSFFNLLRWLLYLNILVFLLTFSLIVIPELIYRYTSGSPPEREDFLVLDLITGGGWMENSTMFYGSYSNTSNNYNIPMAYLLVYSVCYILILIVLIQSISKAYRQYFVTGDKTHGFYSSKAFTGWDFGVTSEETANLKHKSIYLELAEILSSKVRVEKRSCLHSCGQLFLRVFTNLVVFGIIAAACFLIIFMYQEVFNDIDSNIAQEMAVPLIIAGYNLVLPYLFTVITNFEGYKNPRTSLYVSLARVFLMKVVVLITLIVFWLRQVDCEEGNANRASCECWETFAGQEIYKLVIIDFIVQFIATAIAELFVGIGRRFVCKSLNPPEFNIARNTMDLIQAQAYTWIGMYFSPLLMVLCIIKIVLTFYVKKISVLYNCKPSSQAWRAAFAKTVFLIVLFVFFAICGFTVGYIMSQLKPSESCGPFRGSDSPFDIILDVVEGWGWFGTVLEILTSPGFILAIIVVLILAIYYFRTITKGRRKIIKRLKQQITLEGQDKRFLLKRLRDVVGQVASSSTQSSVRQRHPANQARPSSEQPRQQQYAQSGGARGYHTMDAHSNYPGAAHANYPGVANLTMGTDVVLHQ